jgi:hypothetical protein
VRRQPPGPGRKQADELLTGTPDLTTDNDATVELGVLTRIDVR